MPIPFAILFAFLLAIQFPMPFFVFFAIRFSILFAIRFAILLTILSGYYDTNVVSEFRSSCCHWVHNTRLLHMFTSPLIYDHTALYNLGLSFGTEPKPNHSEIHDYDQTEVKIIYCDH